jgi:predicted AAA+ superfamily ATPase
MIDFTKILNLSELAKEKVSSKKREIIEQLRSNKDEVFLGLCGPRGAGKTMLLKQYHYEHQSSCYISIDTLAADEDIFELIRALQTNYRFNTFLLDEVHFNKEINLHLKKLSDFLNVKIIFTSSVALEMTKSAYDLSRRVKLIRVPYFSFREFLSFKGIIDLKPLSMSEILSNQLSSQYLTTDKYLHQYLQGGLLPFALAVDDWKTALSNTVQKIVFEDIPRVHDFTYEDLSMILKSITFIAKSSIDGINTSSLAKNLGVTRYKSEQYLSLLETAFVVQQIFPEGTNVLREPKVTLLPPLRLLHSTFNDSIGALREEFAVDAFSRAGLALSYLKDARGKKMPDYSFELDDKRVLIEVGGPGKTRKQFREEEGVLFVDGPPYGEKRLPLAMLGFLD